MSPLKIIDVSRIEMNELELNMGIFNTKNCMKDAGMTARMPKRHEIKYFKILLSVGMNETNANTVITGRKQSANRAVMFM